MPLSTEERKRIREEEKERARGRRDARREKRGRNTTLAFGWALVVGAVALVAVGVK